MENREWSMENREWSMEARKMAKLCLLGVLVLVAGLMLAGTVAAQARLTATPAQLTVTGARGAVETRTLLLRASEAITNLHVIPLDLTRADGVAVLPGTALHPTLPADQIAANGVLTVPLRFELSGVPGGEFSGELLVGYHGGELTVPVTVKVKDPWPLPLAVLVVGVGLGTGVSVYRAQGRPRDEVLVRLGQLRTQIKADAELMKGARPFYERIEAGLVDVEAALEARTWAQAQQAVEEAKAIWLHWRKGRADWLMQLDYYEKLTRQLEELGKSIFYVRTLEQGVQDVYRNLPDEEGPESFRAKLMTRKEQINKFIELRAQTDALNQLGESSRANALQQRLYNLTPGDDAAYQALKDEVEEATAQARLARLQVQVSKFEKMCTALPEPQAAPRLAKAQELSQRIKTLQPGDDAAYQALQSELDTEMQQIAIMVQPTAESIPFGVRGDIPVPKGVLTTAGMLTSAPTTREQSPGEQADKAETRLRLFTLGSYAITVALLAGAGFSELYVANATFGANTWGDYFALLAWGFGAEATRAAVTEMVRGWGLPGGK